MIQLMLSYLKLENLFDNYYVLLYTLLHYIFILYSKFEPVPTVEEIAGQRFPTVNPKFWIQ